MMKLADEKKKEVRRQIAKLRRQFKNILDQNEGLPVHLQLKKEVRKSQRVIKFNNKFFVLLIFKIDITMYYAEQEFELDREIKLELDKQKTDRIDLVRKELAWEAEKQRIALEKLRKR